MKAYLTFGEETREGYEARTPIAVINFATDSVEEIIGQGVLEIVPDLKFFIEHCHRCLVPGAQAIFTSPYFATANAWANPDTKRGVTEQSLNFAADRFEIAANFAVLPMADLRSDDARTFWMQHYLNVVQAIVITLTKKVLP